MMRSVVKIAACHASVVSAGLFGLNANQSGLRAGYEAVQKIKGFVAKKLKNMWRGPEQMFPWERPEPLFIEEYMLTEMGIVVDHMTHYMEGEVMKTEPVRSFIAAVALKGSGKYADHTILVLVDEIQPPVAVAVETDAEAAAVETSESEAVAVETPKFDYKYCTVGFGATREGRHWLSYRGAVGIVGNPFLDNYLGVNPRVRRSSKFVAITPEQRLAFVSAVRALDRQAQSGHLRYDALTAHFSRDSPEVAHCAELARRLVDLALPHLELKYKYSLVRLSVYHLELLPKGSSSGAGNPQGKPIQKLSQPGSAQHGSDDQIRFLQTNVAVLVNGGSNFGVPIHYEAEAQTDAKVLRDRQIAVITSILAPDAAAPFNRESNVARLLKDVLVVKKGADPEISEFYQHWFSDDGFSVNDMRHCVTKDGFDPQHFKEFFNRCNPKFADDTARKLWTVVQENSNLVARDTTVEKGECRTKIKKTIQELCPLTDGSVREEALAALKYAKSFVQHPFEAGCSADALMLAYIQVYEYQFYQKNTDAFESSPYAGKVGLQRDVKRDALQSVLENGTSLSAFAPELDLPTLDLSDDGMDGENTAPSDEDEEEDA